MLYKVWPISATGGARNAYQWLVDSRFPTVRRFDGSTVGRFDGSTVRRFDGSTVRRLDDSTVRRFDGSTVRRFDGSTGQRIAAGVVSFSFFRLNACKYTSFWADFDPFAP
ncbi:hypothetical protein [Cohnella sp. GCM10012308]|uniref:hypothetical protein n=1 Tax=Cohnella sp. GCM10012308 TaxID=3317329 RepID=UPI0036101C76